ncbi:MAG: radical SAM protein [Verrucomicrobiota bacterium]
MSTNATLDFNKHPCFSREGHQLYGRVHLPVAPRCNIQCNFCNRKFDCVNESRPGVTSSVLTPQQAVEYLAHTIAQRPEIAVAGIAGPGDPFANPEETMTTLRLIRARFPQLMLCVATNGLGIGPYIDELAELKVSHVTITITALDPEISSQIYAWIRDGKRPLRGEAAAVKLRECQLAAITRLKEKGVVVKINSIIIPGINDEHISEVAREVAARGADLMNCMPLKPVAGSEFADLPEPDGIMTSRIRLTCGLHLPQMNHCARCRADAVGRIGEAMTTEQVTVLNHFASMTINPAEETKRPYVAVASMEGALVNQHLGEAERVLIYEPHPQHEGMYQLKEIRKAPEAGGGEERWQELASLLADCRAFLVAAAGRLPFGVLTQSGVKVVEMEGLIEEGLRAVYANTPVPPALKRRFTGCSQGAGCKGAGTGCG